MNGADNSGQMSSMQQKHAGSQQEFVLPSPLNQNLRNVKQWVSNMK